MAGSILTIRKLADRTTGERVVAYDPQTGAKRLVNPATPGDEHEPWPIAGVQIVGAPPQTTSVSTAWVATGVGEGWITREGERLVHRPAGPAADKWRATHTFVHADALVLHTVDGGVRYRVTRQPDKYTVDNDEAPVTDWVYASGQTRVDWFYGLELEG